tara:strand:- start:24132 stop:24848 length:717 start_codon:yes stop_codon:yes gene_type:complete
MEINGVNRNLQQLSSGKRINSASDDAAGSQIVERMSSEINSNSVYISNSLNSVNYINTANSVLDNINNDAMRIRELTIQSGNGIYSVSDKRAIQNEINQLQGNINDIISNSEFNGKPIFQGIQSQISNDNSIEISPTIDNLIDIDVNDPESMQKIDDFLESVRMEQSELGAQANVIDRNVDNLMNKNVNESSARSRIEDLDYAKASSNRSIQEVQENIKLNIQNMENKQKGNLVDLLI